MKKLLILLMAAMFLVACGSKVADNVDEDLADDSIQVMNILNDALENEVLVDDLSQDEVKTLNSYGDKYNEDDRKSTLTFNEVEENIITFSLGTITRYTMYTGLESEKKEITEGKESIEEMIKTGKEYLELDR